MGQTWGKWYFQILIFLGGGIFPPRQEHALFASPFVVCFLSSNLFLSIRCLFTRKQHSTNKYKEYNNITRGQLKLINHKIREKRKSVKPSDIMRSLTVARSSTDVDNDPPLSGQNHVIVYHHSNPTTRTETV